MKGLGVARVIVVGAAGAGLVLGAARVDGVVDLAPAGSTPASDRAPTTVPLTHQALVCPGPEQLGVQGAKDSQQTVRAVAAAAPQSVLPAQGGSVSGGELSQQRMPGQQQGPAHTDRGGVVETTLAEPRALLVLAGGGFAPGAAAMQYSLVGKGDGRALSTVACGAPQAQSWLVAGGAQPGRLEHLVLANPAANAVTVDVQVLGTKGPIDSPNGRGVVVPAHGRTAILLDSIAGDETAPVVHVTAHGGAVYAAVSDTWLDGVVARGGDTSVPTAAPSTQQVIGGLALRGPASLRVAVPGDAQAVVQIRVLTTKGPRRVKHDVVRVDGHTTRDIDLSDLPPGSYAVEVRADVPVVASAVVERGRDASGSKSGAGSGSGGKAAATSDAGLDRTPTDLAWTPSSPAIEVVAGTPLPTGKGHGVTNRLMLSTTGARSDVTVTTVDAKGKLSTAQVTVPSDSVRVVRLKAAASVWVQPEGDSVHGAVITQAVGDDDGTLIAAMPLRSTPLTMTQTPIRRSGG